MVAARLLTSCAKGDILTNLTPCPERIGTGLRFGVVIAREKLHFEHFRHPGKTKPLLQCVRSRGVIMGSCEVASDHRLKRRPPPRRAVAIKGGSDWLRALPARRDQGRQQFVPDQQWVQSLQAGRPVAEIMSSMRWYLRVVNFSSLRISSTMRRCSSVSGLA